MGVDMEKQFAERAHQSWPEALRVVSDLLQRLSEETSRADRAEEKMRAGWIEVCQSGLAKFKRERDEAVTYAGRLEELLIAIRCHADPTSGWPQKIDAVLAKDHSIAGASAEAVARNDGCTGSIPDGNQGSTPSPAITEFEVYTGDDFQASTYGPRDLALAEARNYARQYVNDGPTRIEEVTRRLVETLSLK